MEDGPVQEISPGPRQKRPNVRQKEYPDSKKFYSNINSSPELIFTPIKRIKKS